MLRLIWLLIVGSWRFPWERGKPPPQLTPLAPPKSLPEYQWDDVREGCGYECRVDERDIVRECNGAPSEWCSAGRCRVHCAATCKCETTRPDVPTVPALIDHPREGGTYRAPPS